MITELNSFSHFSVVLYKLKYCCILGSQVFKAKGKVKRCLMLLNYVVSYGVVCMA